jgi:hypothetical protein
MFLDPSAVKKHIEQCCSIDSQCHGIGTADLSADDLGELSVLLAHLLCHRQLLRSSDKSIFMDLIESTQPRWAGLETI